MFGSFDGPLPEGTYVIRPSNDLSKAIYVPSIINDAVVSGIVYQENSNFQKWIFEYGEKGYRIKNQANGNCLSYVRWGVPSRFVNNTNTIVATADSPVEWELVQTSFGAVARLFQIRMVAGHRLLPTDDYSLSWTGSYGITLAVGAYELPTRPLVPGNRSKVVIRSAYYSGVALDVFHGDEDSIDNPSNAVVGSRLNGKFEQVWILVKSGGNFKIRNAASEDYLGYAMVPNTLSGTWSVVANEVTASTDFKIVQSSHGYVLSTPINVGGVVKDYVVTLYNLDTVDNSWVRTDQLLHMQDVKSTAT
ncbi:hypothetical protein FRB97_005658 [Tulasnella sp. 331]|nr:hypothetical protein FRB97_005658 [Tulasnella sp. 331]KAG8879651.1 hypothetical protein FRB98_005578 [Tulasnella sp. 332]